MADNPARVLIVDDEEDVILLCSVNLEAEGHEVLEARNGKEALQVLRDQRPDLVFLDIMMPVMDGWECLAEIRADAELSQIPVVLLTAKVNSEDQLRGLSSGADDYVTKPFHPSTLTRVVPMLAGAALQDRQQRREEMIRKLRMLERI